MLSPRAWDRHMFSNMFHMFCTIAWLTAQTHTNVTPFMCTFAVSPERNAFVCQCFCQGSHGPHFHHASSMRDHACMVFDICSNPKRRFCNVPVETLRVTARTRNKNKTRAFPEFIAAENCFSSSPDTTRIRQTKSHRHPW